MKKLTSLSYQQRRIIYDNLVDVSIELIQACSDLLANPERQGLQDDLAYSQQELDITFDMLCGRRPVTTLDEAD